MLLDRDLDLKWFCDQILISVFSPLLLRIRVKKFSRKNLSVISQIVLELYKCKV